jgi:hypothetical protein
MKEGVFSFDESFAISNITLPSSVTNIDTSALDFLNCRKVIVKYNDINKKNRLDEVLNNASWLQEDPKIEYVKD